MFRWTFDAGRLLENSSRGAFNHSALARLGLAFCYEDQYIYQRLPMRRHGPTQTAYRPSCHHSAPTKRREIDTDSQWPSLTSVQTVCRYHERTPGAARARSWPVGRGSPSCGASKTESRILTTGCIEAAVNLARPVFAASRVVGRSLGLPPGLRCLDLRRRGRAESHPGRIGRGRGGIRRVGLRKEERDRT